MYLGKAPTSSNIAWHRPMSDTFRLEEELMDKSTRALDSTTDPVEKLRLLCLSHGAAGILACTRTFRRMDDGTNRLNKEQFMNGLEDTGLKVDDDTAEALFEKFDPDNSGSINLDEFIKEIRPPMSEYRRGIVCKVFEKLDKTGEGIIHVGDIRRVYSVNSHPRYMSGEETAELVMSRFLASFDTEGSDGSVTLEEFMDYYSGLSLGIDKDGFFDLMMRQSYKL